MINPSDELNKTTIKVIGLGGGGSNAIDRMMQVGIAGVEFITANTDLQALARSKAPVKVKLGPALTRGLGAGGKPGVGARAAEESYDDLIAALRGADMVFLTAGMGGGTGTGAISVAAQAAREVGALTLAVVTMPFSFEGTTRERNANEGIVRLREQVHTLITVPNDRLLTCTSPGTTLQLAFCVADDVLRQGVQGIAELVTRPGLINLDFASVRQMIEMSGGAVMAVGHGKGEGRAVEAARRALSHPLLDADAVRYAAGVLVNFTGGPDMTLLEVTEAADLIRTQASPDAYLLFGTAVDETMTDRVQATLVATGVGAQPISDVLGEGADEAIVRRRQVSSWMPGAPERTRVEAQPASQPAAQRTYWSSGDSLDDTRAGSTSTRGSLDVPAFLRRGGPR
jgi:cell division protein FtsZ